MVLLHQGLIKQFQNLFLSVFDAVLDLMCVCRNSKILYENYDFHSYEQDSNRSFSGYLQSGIHILTKGKLSCESALFGKDQ